MHLKQDVFDVYLMDPSMYAGNGIRDIMIKLPGAEHGRRMAAH